MVCRARSAGDGAFADGRRRTAAGAESNVQADASLLRPRGRRGRSGGAESQRRSGGRRRRIRGMARLIRMDHTGHSTVAEWTVGDDAAFAAAARAFREQLDDGCYAIVTRGEGHAEQVRELP